MAVNRRREIEERFLLMCRTNANSAYVQDVAWLLVERRRLERELRDALLLYADHRSPNRRLLGEVT